MEQLLPAFHGNSARALAYAAAKGSTTAEEMRKDLNLPRSTVYKLLSQLVDAGLVTKEKAQGAERLRVPDFVFFIKNTALVGECKITSRNVLAFDSAHTPAGKMFISRHGWRKFAKFVELYDEFERGKVTSQLTARELGVTRYEIEILLSDIRAMAPFLTHRD